MQKIEFNRREIFKCMKKNKDLKIKSMNSFHRRSLDEITGIKWKFSQNNIPYAFDYFCEYFLSCFIHLVIYAGIFHYFSWRIYLWIKLVMFFFHDFNGVHWYFYIYSHLYSHVIIMIMCITYMLQVFFLPSG